MGATGITKSDVKAFVEAAHGDLDRVRQLLADRPLLLSMANGNETALGAACQMKRKDIIEFLLAQGAPMDIYAACVLGLTDQVAAFLDADPLLINSKKRQSHGKPLISFASEQPETLALLTRRGAR
ncbi:MAG TPA: ankyrin repeat domain-containing protein [Armatimonadota bacterium]|nr:ankyrin repeat domain-containing protein [Armatimonadota bacterium]